MLIMVAVVAIGIFALPGTIAMFGGQHNWYDLSPNSHGQGGWGGNDVPCEKCHADVADELSNSGIHENFTCAMCHRTAFTNYTYARGNFTYGAAWQGTIPGEEAHAASTVACMDCHDGNRDGGAGHSLYPGVWDPEIADASECGISCHASNNYNATVFSASGFGLTPWGPDTGEKAAHLAFVWGANGTNSTLMEGTNEACIACHTHVAIDINWTHKYKMSLYADGSSGDWTVENFITEGTYNVTTYGNMSGGTTGVTDPVVKWDNGTEVTDP